MSNRSVHGAEIFGAFLHPDVAGGAGIVAAAGVVERDVIVQRHVEDGLLFAVIFVRQLAVFKLHGLAFGQEGDLYRFFGERLFAGGVFGHGAGSLRLFF
jgi:hypothetical protein